MEKHSGIRAVTDLAGKKSGRTGSRRKMLAALCLAAMLLCGLSGAAGAATIVVTQNTSTGTTGNESYEAYKIFDVSKIASQKGFITTAAGAGSEEGFAYYIDAESAWVNVLMSDKGKTYFTLSRSAEGDVYTVQLVDGNNTEEKAREIAGWLLANKPAQLAAVDKQYSFTTDNRAVDVDDGYYLITSSLGTNLILATTNINITEKNEYVVDQKVAETASVTIGEDAVYYIEVYLPASVDPEQKVTVHDELSEKLKFNHDVQVYIGDADPGSGAAEYKALTYSETLPEAFTVKTEGLAHTACTFELEINTAGLAGKYLVFRYSAELTSEARAGGNGYTNKEYVTYANGYTSTSSQPAVMTYDLNLSKTNGTSKLNGAVFELRKDAEQSSSAMKFIRTGYYTNGLYTTASQTATEYTGAALNAKVADRDDTDTTTNLVAGDLNIAGLGAGTYYLVETIAPAGYNRLTSPLVVTVTDDGNVNVTLDGTSVSDNGIFKVVNRSGVVLPSTGGIGTTLFYVLGILLVSGAGVFMVVRRRRTR